MAVCHRCGEVVDGGAAAVFCGQCGAPQLYVSEDDADEGEAVAEAMGATPPAASRTGLVDWDAAMQAAGIVAAIGLVLYASEAWLIQMAVLSGVWVLVSGQFAVNLYRKARPQARLDGAVGARVGAVTGVMLAAAKAVALCGGLWAQRFPLHHAAQMDAQYAQAMQETQQMLVKLFGAVPPEETRLLLSPEYRAWTSIAEAIFGGLIVLLLVMAGGALSGFLNKRRTTV